MNRHQAPNSRIGTFIRRTPVLPIASLSILVILARRGFEQPIFLLFPLIELPLYFWSKASGWLVSDGQLHILRWPRWTSVPLAEVKVVDHKPLINYPTADLVAHLPGQRSFRLHASKGGLRLFASLIAMKQQGAQVAWQWLELKESEIPEYECFRTTICHLEFLPERFLIHTVERQIKEVKVEDAAMICECQQNWLFATARLVLRLPGGVTVPLSQWGADDEFAACAVLRAFASRGGLVDVRQGRAGPIEDLSHDLPKDSDA